MFRVPASKPEPKDHASFLNFEYQLIENPQVALFQGSLQVGKGLQLPSSCLLSEISNTEILLPICFLAFPGCRPR